MKQTWLYIKGLQSKRRSADIGAVKKAIPHGKVLTDLHEIYRAALDGKGELLVVHQNYK